MVLRQMLVCREIRREGILNPAFGSTEYLPSFFQGYRCVGVRSGIGPIPQGDLWPMWYLDSESGCG